LVQLLSPVVAEAQAWLTVILPSGHSAIPREPLRDFLGLFAGHRPPCVAKIRRTHGASTSPTTGRYFGYRELTGDVRRVSCRLKFGHERSFMMVSAASALWMTFSAAPNSLSQGCRVPGGAVAGCGTDERGGL